jgi:peptide/nickel transport system substrate-binding protein
MRRVRRAGAALAGLVGVATIVAGCGSSGGGNSPTEQTTANVGQNQIKHVPYANVKNGGNLNWPVNAQIVQFNTNEIDGNTLDAVNVMDALMPTLFLADAVGNFRFNPDYLTGEPAVTMVNGHQTVTYEINSKAKWQDGTQLSAQDFIAQWKAMNGKNPAYKPVATTGYDDVTAVVQGKNAQEAVVTFNKPFGEWRSIFSLLYPASTNNNPNTFNTGWAAKPIDSAGPFVFATADTKAQTYTIKPNPSWWGQQPKLASITYRAIDPAAQAGALNNNEIDFLDVGPDAATYAQVKAFQGVDLRAAGGPNFRHITVNGSSPELADLTTRQALSMGIDRNAIARAMLTPLGFRNATALNNHIYMKNQVGYQDNSAPTGVYNPAKAAQMLTAQGWVVSGANRVNNGQVQATSSQQGKTLKINFVIPSGVPVSLNEAKLIQAQLKQINVEVDINTVDINHFFDQYISTGQFDMTVFSYIGTPFPISGSAGTYLNKVGNSWNANFSRVGSPEIDNALNTALQQLDPKQAIVQANNADKLIWNEVMVLPTYQRPDIWAVRSNVVNFGAFGFATPDYTVIGFAQ